MRRRSRGPSTCPVVGVNHLEGHLYAAWLLDPGRARAAGARLPARRPRGVRRPHAPRGDARPPRVPAPGRDRGRRRRRGVRQGRAPSGPRLPRRAGHRGSGSRRGRPDRSACRAPGWATRTTSASRGSRRPCAGSSRRSSRAPGQPAAEAGGRLPAARVAVLAAAFQESVVDVLAAKTLRAAEATGARSIVVGGGVASNCRPARAAGRRGRVPRRGPRHPAAGAVHGQRGDDRRRRRTPAGSGRACAPRPRAPGHPGRWRDRSGRPRRAARRRAAPRHAPTRLRATRRPTRPGEQRRDRRASRHPPGSRCGPPDAPRCRDAGPAALLPELPRGRRRPGGDPRGRVTGARSARAGDRARPRDPDGRAARGGRPRHRGGDRPGDGRPPGRGIRPRDRRRHPGAGRGGLPRRGPGAPSSSTPTTSSPTCPTTSPARSCTASWAARPGRAPSAVS